MTELIAICDLCRRPVNDRAGSLYIDLAEVQNYQRDRDEWRATHPGPVRLGDVLNAPARPCWRVRHDDCDADRDAFAYEIGVEQIRTWRDLSRWTAHLFEKNWFAATDWGHLMRDLADNSGTRIQAAGAWGQAA